MAFAPRPIGATSVVPPFGGRIALGDFNAAPGAEEIQPALQILDAGGEPTHGSARIDCAVYRGDALEFSSVQTVDMATRLGVEALDDRPVLTTFRIK